MNVKCVSEIVQSRLIYRIVTPCETRKPAQPPKIITQLAKIVNASAELHQEIHRPVLFRQSIR